jgi:ribose transport system permease protein
MAKWLEWLQKYQGVAGLGLLLAVAAFVAPRVDGHSTFFNEDNLQNVLSQLAVPGVLAIGTTFVIVAGSIDLSVGSGLGLLNCITATWLLSGTATWLTFLYVAFIGMLIGAIQGYVIGITKLQPFIVTLAGLVSLRGIAYVYTQNANVSGISGKLDFLNQNRGPVPVAGWILIAMTLVGAVVLTHTAFGRRVYAIGGNPTASHYAGVPVNRVRVGAFAINGICVAVAAILFTARNNNGQPSAGNGYELDAITAAVVGGTALMGGYGSVLGTFVGALFIVCLNVLLILKGVNYFVGQGWKGVIILLAVYMQNIGRRS